VIPLFGSLFPGWILVVAGAGVATVALTAALRAAGLGGAIPLKPFFNLALFLLLAFVFWDLLYGNR
jgi:hypothetical protein